MRINSQNQQYHHYSPHYQQQNGMYSAGSSGLPSPVNPPPELSINNVAMSMKQKMHLPLAEHSQQYQYNGSSALYTPMSLGGSSSVSEMSPMTPMHPGVNMVNTLINDFDRSMDLKRKAPGCERSNTAPNLFVNLPSGCTPGVASFESTSPRNETSEEFKPEQGQTDAIEVENKDMVQTHGSENRSEDIGCDTAAKDKKYRAMKGKE
jgi:hypothetical protein